MTSYKFKLVSSDNLDAFLQAIGVPEDRRKAVEGAEVTIEISTDAEGYTLFTTNYGPRSFTHRYKLDEEYEYQRSDGSKIKAKVTKGEGHTYTTVEQYDGFEVKHVREFAGGELKQTSTAKGVTATQVYQKV